MQLVVVMAVRNAVSAATITFTAISTIRFFINLVFFLNTNHTNLTNINLRVAKIRVIRAIRGFKIYPFNPFNPLFR